MVISGFTCPSNFISTGKLTPERSISVERQRVIDGVAKNLKESYVYPDLAQKMEDVIRANHKRGEYDAISDPDVFASRLTRYLRAVSHDRHVWGHNIDDHFMIGVPFARAINPATKTDWEGTGIEPDIKVLASQALDVAVKLVADHIKENEDKTSQRHK